MENQRKNKLMTKVFVIGLVVAILSYLFHPDVGQFSITMNGRACCRPVGSFCCYSVIFSDYAHHGRVDGNAVCRGWRVHIYGRPIYCIFWSCCCRAFFLADTAYYFSDNRTDVI